jgi:hypothetical protein
MRSLISSLIILAVCVIPARTQGLSYPELFDAVEQDRVEQLKVLLTQNLTIKTEDRYKATLHHRAARSRAIKSLRLLLSLGADVNLRDEDGETPLMEAHTPQIIEILLAAGADINAKDDKGKTALIRAVEFGELTVVKCLLRNKADPTIKTPEGKTALDIAMKSKLKNTQAVLRSEMSLEPRCALPLISERTPIPAKLRDGQGRNLLDGQGRELQVNVEVVFTLAQMINSHSFNGKLEVSVPEEERRKIAGSLGRDWIDVPSAFSLNSATAEFPKESELQRIITSSHLDLELLNLTVPEKDGNSGLSLVTKPARLKIKHNSDTIAEMIRRQILTMFVGRGYSKHRIINDLMNCLEFEYEFSN